jgi:eukaryotic-like serine/threonine-protein kinase
MSFHVGQTFGDYTITAMLGAGAMGRVYKVEHTLTQRAEAMKVLSAELASDVQIKRFEREMRSLAKLNHPNIAALHNAVHSDDELILLMEYIEGQTLESLFQTGRLPLEAGAGYVKQVLAALGYAHGHGIVHRDVNPANVMITAAGQAKLTDFGLSKSYGDSLLTNCGEVLGSLPYMAPEQVKGTTQPDRRSDLYSVGAILYEHLTGQKPFGPNRRLAAVVTDTEADPLPPSQLEPALAAGWDEILQRALARDPARRYQSAEEFLSAIARLEEPAVADLPLPRPGTLGIGIALFAGLMLALVASPSVERLLRPGVIAGQRFHIAPPLFATAVSRPAPLPAPIAVAISKPRPVRRPKHRAVRTPVAEFAQPLADPKPVAVTRTAPVALSPVSAPNLISRRAITPAPPQADSSSSPPGAAAATPRPSTPAVSDETENPPATPHKKHFWRKWNPFRNRHAASEEKGEDQTEEKP